jgi:hypothetical protein
MPFELAKVPRENPAPEYAKRRNRTMNGARMFGTTTIRDRPSMGVRGLTTRTSRRFASCGVAGVPPQTPSAAVRPAKCGVQIPRRKTTMTWNAIPCLTSFSLLTGSGSYARSAEVQFGQSVRCRCDGKWAAGGRVKPPLKKRHGAGFLQPQRGKTLGAGQSRANLAFLTYRPPCRAALRRTGCHISSCQESPKGRRSTPCWKRKQSNGFRRHSPGLSQYSSGWIQENPAQPDSSASRGFTNG